MVVKAPPKSGKTFSYACAVVDRISLKPPTFIETVIVTETSAQANSVIAYLPVFPTMCSYVLVLFCRLVVSSRFGEPNALSTIYYVRIIMCS